MRKLSEFVPTIKAADYTTLFKRIAKMKIPLPETIADNEKNEVHLLQYAHKFELIWLC